MVKTKHQCPVCGYLMADPPKDNNICPSCGTEFGYHDAGRTFADIRKEWAKAEAPWSSIYVHPPKDWNPYVQMLNAGLIEIKLSGDLASFKIDVEPVQTGNIVYFERSPDPVSQAR